MGIIVM